MDSGPVIVSIKCTVLNQAPYLRQCLDGFVMQKADFRFQAIVHDDASTDGSADIIREYVEKYPDIIIPIIETENQYSKADGSLARIMDAAIPESCRYIAICEGDDYWTDPCKLQKQVDFLDAHPDYGLVYGKCLRYDQDSLSFTQQWGGDAESFDQLFQGNVVPTLSTMFRRELYFEYVDCVKPDLQGWPMGDFPLWLYLSRVSKVKFMPEVFGVYRILNFSASHNTDINRLDRFSLGRAKMLADICRHFDIDRQEWIDDDLEWQLTKNACKVNERKEARRRSKRIKHKNFKARCVSLASLHPVTFKWCLSKMVK